MLLGIVIVSLLLWQVESQNFCDAGLCPSGTRHIACLNSGQFADNCQGNMINMRPYIDLILQLHNEPRNLIAGGGLAGFPSAVQMGQMSWDPDLALTAAYNALQCRMQHDQCRNTQAYRYAGQNLSILFTRRTGISEFLRQRIPEWFNEYRYARSDDVENYNPRGGNTIGHFTAMVNERNNRVGCAVAQYTDATRVDATLLVCNYAVTNVIDNPVYRFGPAASQCAAGRAASYPNLCAIEETYNYNQWAG